MMTLEQRIATQMGRNAPLLAQAGLETHLPPVYTIIDTDTAAAEFLGLSESEYEAFLAGVFVRNWDDCEVEGD